MSVPEPDEITVKCPHCGETFDTHDVGDLVACVGCDRLFERFGNIHEGDKA